MNTAYYQGNRERLYAMMQPGSLLMLFSGEEIRKTNDEYYPFFRGSEFCLLYGTEVQAGGTARAERRRGQCRGAAVSAAAGRYCRALDRHPGQAAGSGKRFRR